MKYRLYLIVTVALLLTGCVCIPQQEVDSECDQSTRQVNAYQDEKLESIPGSCTTFAVQIGDQVLFGNNEDYENPLTYYWVVPSTDAGYGGIYLGYAYGRPQGGINEKGLAFDGLALDPEPLNHHPEWPNTTSSFTGFMAKVLQQSADVEQAVEMVTHYNWGKTVAHQILIADASGDAAIIGAGADGELAVTRKPSGDGYLLGTNFNVVQLGDDAFEVPCWRYTKAQQMLDRTQKKGDLSVDGVFNILDKVHQEGRTNNTLYSNVFDLKNGIVYLIYWYQFDEFIKLNVADEVNKRNNNEDPPNTSDKVRIVTLFSEQTVSRAKREFQRYINKNENLAKIAWVWVIQSFICVCLLFVDLMRQSSIPWAIKAIWLLVSCLLGVVGLLVYWATFKRPSTKSLSVSKFAKALGSSTLSSVGCTFAVFQISLLVFFFAQDANLGLFALIVPLAIILFLFRVPMMAYFTQEKYWKNVRKYLLPELISTLVVVIGIICVDQNLGNYFNQYSRYIGTPSDIFFWVKFSLYAVCGLIVLYPLHLLLVHFKVNLWPVEFPRSEEVAVKTT